MSTNYPDPEQWCTVEQTDHGIAFDRELHLIDDLGYEPGDPDDPKNPPDVVDLDAHVESGTKLIVPPGEWPIKRSGNIIVDREDLRRFALVADDPDAKTWLHPHDRRSCYLFWIRGGEDVLLRGITYDYGWWDSGALGNVLLVDDGLYIQDVHKIGASNDNEGYGGRDADGQLMRDPSAADRWWLFLAIKREDGHGYVENVSYTGPAHITGHAQSRGMGGAFTKHAGTLHWTGCYSANNPGDSLYTGTHGTHEFDRFFSMNSAMAGIRTYGVVKNSRVVYDFDAQPAENTGEFKSTNLLYWDPQNSQRAGGRIESSTFEIHDAANPNAIAGAGYAGDTPPCWGVNIDSSGGEVAIVDCDIIVNADRVPAIFAHADHKRWGRYPQDDDAEPDEEIVIRDCRLRGTGRLPNTSHARTRYQHAAIILEARRNCVVESTAVEMPNAAFALSLLPWEGNKATATVRDCLFLSKGTVHAPAGGVTDEGIRTSPPEDGEGTDEEPAPTPTPDPEPEPPQDEGSEGGESASVSIHVTADGVELRGPVDVDESLRQLLGGEQ